MANSIITLYPRLEPGSAEAEERFSALIDRLRGVRIQARIVSAQLEEFGRQFVDNDMYEIGGASRGQVLDTEGRRKRLQRMAELHQSYLGYLGQETEVLCLLSRLESATDASARAEVGPRTLSPSKGFNPESLEPPLGQ